jgi:hypothetical protein
MLNSMNIYEVMNSYVLSVIYNTIIICGNLVGAQAPPIRSKKILFVVLYRPNIRF